MQKEHKENSFDGRENTSTSGEFGEIWRCFQWRHSREEPYTSRQRIIAQAGCDISACPIKFHHIQYPKNNQIEVENNDCFRDKKHAKNVIISRE